MILGVVGLGVSKPDDAQAAWLHEYLLLPESLRMGAMASYTLIILS